MPQYNQLYTPQDSAIVFIDHQPQMLFGVANVDRSLLINNVTLLAKVGQFVVATTDLCSLGGYVTLDNGDFAEVQV